MEFVVRGPLFKYIPDGERHSRRVYLCCMDHPCQCTTEEKDEASEQEYHVSITDRVLVRYDPGEPRVYDLINEKELEVDNDDNGGRCLNSLVSYEGSMLTVQHLLRL